MDSLLYKESIVQIYLRFLESVCSHKEHIAYWDARLTRTSAFLLRLRLEWVLTIFLMVDRGKLLLGAMMALVELVEVPWRYYPFCWTAVVVCLHLTLFRESLPT